MIFWGTYIQIDQFVTFKYRALHCIVKRMILLNLPNYNLLRPYISCIQHVMRIFSQGLSETALTTQNLGCFNEAFHLPVFLRNLAPFGIWHPHAKFLRDIGTPCTPSGNMVPPHYILYTAKTKLLFWHTTWLLKECSTHKVFNGTLVRSTSTQVQCKLSQTL